MIWGALLAVTALLVYHTRGGVPREEVVDAATDSGHRRESSRLKSSMNTIRPRPPAQSKGGEFHGLDMFRPKSWAPPPEPTVEVAPLEVVERPPDLPFRYVGELSNSNGKWLVQLMEGDRYLVAAKGDVIDDRYRLVDFVAGQLHFFYMPMSLEQTLDVGE